jgi:hypothetical protein
MRKTDSKKYSHCCNDQHDGDIDPNCRIEVGLVIVVRNMSNQVG